MVWNVNCKLFAAKKKQIRLWNSEFVVESGTNIKHDLIMELIDWNLFRIRKKTVFECFYCCCSFFLHRWGKWTEIHLKVIAIAKNKKIRFIDGIELIGLTQIRIEIIVKMIVLITNHFRIFLNVIKCTSDNNKIIVEDWARFLFKYVWKLRRNKHDKCITAK